MHDIKLAAAKTGVPARWIAAEMLLESGGKNVCFEGLRTQACGLMQLEPQTARDLPGWSPGARMVPQENLILGAELLGGLHRFLGSWRLKAAYYGGLGAVVVSLIVVAVARSGHPRTAAAAAHHRTAPLAVSASGAATKESEAEARSDP